MKLEHFVILHTKTNPKWIKGQNIRLETITFLKENRQDTDLNRTDIYFWVYLLKQRKSKITNKNKSKQI